MLAPLLALSAAGKVGFIPAQPKDKVHDCPIKTIRQAVDKEA
jgi:hypothetical protein